MISLSHYTSKKKKIQINIQKKKNEATNWNKNLNKNCVFLIFILVENIIYYIIKQFV